MPIKYRFIITAEDENAFFADPDRACADIARILVDRVKYLLDPEFLVRHAVRRAFEVGITDVDLPAILEGQPYNLPTVNGTQVFLTLVIQRGELHKLRK